MSILRNKRKCPVCGSGSKQILPLFQGRFESMKKDYTVSQCKHCSFVHQNPAWPRSFYETMYETVVYDPIKNAYAPEIVKRFKEIASIIESLPELPSKLKLLDYGCYDGSFTEWLRHFHKSKKHYDLFGFDISLKDEAVKKLPYFNDLSKLTRLGPTFDVVTLNHVLEHVYDPVALLTRVKKKLLKSNGYIVIELPDMSFVKRNDFSPFHIQHVNYFTPETLSLALRKAGLSAVFLRSFRNYDIERDPCYPSIILVGQKDPDFLVGGADIVDVVEDNRGALRKKLASLPRGATLAIAGCGDPLSYVVKNLPTHIKLVSLHDNNKDLWGKKLFGRTVESVAKLSTNNVDAVFVCTVHERKSNTLGKQIHDLGFKGNIIKVFGNK